MVSALFLKAFDNWHRWFKYLGKYPVEWNIEKKKLKSNPFFPTLIPWLFWTIMEILAILVFVWFLYSAILGKIHIMVLEAIIAMAYLSLFVYTLVQESALFLTKSNAVNLVNYELNLV